ncbi:MULTISPECIES: hypothetical protein [unclassified Neisseria]|nr:MULTISPECIES: hypothetical protein [unclassified Neisseria]MDU1534564.1 hypothetical protein [Neisseria sp.]
MPSAVQTPQRSSENAVSTQLKPFQTTSSLLSLAPNVYNPPHHT